MRTAAITAASLLRRQQRREERRPVVYVLPRRVGETLALRDVDGL
jgi:hypothetical protein